MDGTEHAMAGLREVVKALDPPRRPRAEQPRTILDDWANRWIDILPDDAWCELQMILERARAWR